jgi:hypothetical protein
MTSGDAVLLGELRDMWTTYDPPPPGLVATMVAAVAAAGLDEEWEMLVLLRDSADRPAAEVRGLSTARVLYFSAASGWSLDAEIDGAQVRGQLLDYEGDLTSVEVTVETTDDQTWTTPLDESGFFLIEAEPTGSVRFTVRSGDSVSSSRWVQL